MHNLAKCKTIPELLKLRAQQSPNAIAQRYLNDSHSWESTSWYEYHQVVTRLANALTYSGLKPGDRFGIIAPTCREWDYIQMAIMATGGVVVGIDPYDRDENINHVADTSGLSGIVAKNQQLLNKVSDDVLSDLKLIITIDDLENNHGSQSIYTLSQLLGLADTCPDQQIPVVEGSFPATIIFTSGTTGIPKGIEYTHEQVCFACNSILGAFPEIREGSHLMCWLPLSNLFQRIINICAIGRGAETYYIENPRDVMKYINGANPHIFIGVPRFFEKLYEGILAKIELQPAWLRSIITYTLSISNKYHRNSRENSNPSIYIRFIYFILDTVVLKRLKNIMGTNLQYLISGSAPMSQHLLEQFHALDMVILEAYGLSENICPIAVNRPSLWKFGTVGRPLPGNEITISGDSELLVKGPGVFHGYFGEDVHNNINTEGYLATGDYASINNDGFITLTGRKSEVFKTSTGRKIAPVTIEALLNNIPYVEHAVIFGAEKKYLIALLSISPVILSRWTGIPDYDSLTGEQLHDISHQIRQEVDAAVLPLPRHLRPAGLMVSFQPFSIEGGELTSNLKMRRKFIAEKYTKAIDDIYQNLEQSNQKTADMTPSTTGIVFYNS